MKNILITLLVVGLSIFSLILYFKNRELNRNIDTLIKVASQELDRQSLIDNCMNDAYEVYMLNWNDACDSLGLGVGCSLPMYKSERIDEMKKTDEDRCITRYK